MALLVFCQPPLGHMMWSAPSALLTYEIMLPFSTKKAPVTLLVGVEEWGWGGGANAFSNQKLIWVLYWAGALLWCGVKCILGSPVFLSIHTEKLISLLRDDFHELSETTHLILILSFGHCCFATQDQWQENQLYYRDHKISTLHLGTTSQLNNWWHCNQRDRNVI